VRNRLSRWLVPGDQYCSSGINSGEQCGWVILQMMHVWLQVPGDIIRV
jgi:hypothetical protein